MKNLSILIIAIFLFSNASYACSMYKITQDLKVKNTKGKRKVSESELIAPIMHNYSNVRAVKAHLSKINLSIDCRRRAINFG